MVQSYALLVIPFASGLVVMSKKKYLRVILLLFIGACIYLNLMFTWIYKNSLMLTDGMTRSMYKELLFHPISAYIPLSKRNDRMQWNDDFIESRILISEDLSERSIHTGDFSGIMDTNGSEVLKMKGKWIRCSYETRFQPAYKILPNSVNIVNEIRVPKGKTRFWKGKFFTNQFGDSQTISGWVSRIIDFRVPENLYNENQYLLYFWVTEKSTACIRNVKVYGLTIKN